MSSIHEFFLTEAPGDDEEKDAEPAADEAPAGKGEPAEPADVPEGEAEDPEGSAEDEGADEEGEDAEDEDLEAGDESGGEPSADPGAGELEAEQETNRRVRLYDAIAATRADLKSLTDSATTVSQLANDRRVRKTSEEIAERTRQAVEQSDLLLKGFNAIGLEHAKAVYDTFAERAKTCAALLNHLIDGDEGFTSGASAASAKPHAS